MDKYIINQNAQSTGEHEVHKEIICPTLPLPENRVLIGYFSSCRDATMSARSQWPNATIDGCENCIPTCHTR
ncbi:MAG: hypothetical protein NUV78_03080 [Candidatus Zambryskibacteria bacterium]|nr:hypothetical protein [Candidatus Zambryskibacteria bacterium]